MKLKLQFLALFCCLPFMVFAQANRNNDFFEQRKEIFKGLPLPYSGIKIVPRAEMKVSLEKQKIFAYEAQQLKQNGYIDSYSFNAQQLLSMRDKAPLEVEAYKQNTDALDTHLKAKHEDIKLAFPFNGLPAIAPDAILGYAAVGMWKEKGWTGMATYFDDKGLGVCLYTLNNVTLTGGAKLIAAESVRYDVNHKPTTVTVRGNHQSGFFYAIRWGDNNYFHDLECANAFFDAEITSNMIAYAKVIDKNQV